MTFNSLSQFGLSIALKPELLGEKFTMRGDTFYGAIDDIALGETFVEGGPTPSQPITVTMKLRTFSPALNLGERITARGSNYTVRQIITDQTSITLVCDLVNKR